MHSFVIVLYGQKIEESPTYISLVKLVNSAKIKATLFIWDNSATRLHDEKIKSASKYLKIHYFYKGHNVNLSNIYNKLLPLAYETSDIVTILDQDSELPLNFFASINENVNDTLLVPRVISNVSGEMISPRYQNYTHYLNKCNIQNIPKDCLCGYYNSNQFFAVASGLTIPKKVWETGPDFRSCLSFYGVDTEYCYDYSQVKSKFYLLNACIYHDASNESEESYRMFKWRLEKYHEHWLFQLVNRAGWNEEFSRYYASFFNNYYLFKNKIKRIVRNH
ncbi:TPA: hypothetical protein ACMD2Y_001701 [Vibrio parahaemolyticus]|nr:hypothetical protein [Vibrio parahaemolyticus]